MFTCVLYHVQIFSIMFDRNFMFFMIFHMCAYVFHCFVMQFSLLCFFFLTYFFLFTNPNGCKFFWIYFIQLFNFISWWVRYICSWIHLIIWCVRQRRSRVQHMYSLFHLIISRFHYMILSIQLIFYLLAIYLYRNYNFFSVSVYLFAYIFFFLLVFCMLFPNFLYDIQLIFRFCVSFVQNF